MSGRGRGVSALKSALEELISVESCSAGWEVRVNIQAAGGGRYPVAAPRPTYDQACLDAQRLLDALAIGLMPVAQAVFTDACGCTDDDPVLCCEAALERLGLSLSRPFWPCHCQACHPTASPRGRGQGAAHGG